MAIVRFIWSVVICKLDFLPLEKVRKVCWEDWSEWKCRGEGKVFTCINEIFEAWKFMMWNGFLQLIKKNYSERIEGASSIRVTWDRINRQENSVCLILRCCQIYCLSWNLSCFFHTFLKRRIFTLTLARKIETKHCDQPKVKKKTFIECVRVCIQTLGQTHVVFQNSAHATFPGTFNPDIPLRTFI